MHDFRKGKHDFRRNSKTFEQIAQKRAEKFGVDNIERSRERSFAAKQRKFADETIKKLCWYSGGESAHILFDMGTIPEKY